MPEGARLLYRHFPEDDLFEDDLFEDEIRGESPFHQPVDEALEGRMSDADANPVENRPEGTSSSSESGKRNDELHKAIEKYCQGIHFTQMRFGHLSTLPERIPDPDAVPDHDNPETENTADDDLWKKYLPQSIKNLLDNPIVCQIKIKREIQSSSRSLLGDAKKTREGVDALFGFHARVLDDKAKVARGSILLLELLLGQHECDNAKAELSQAKIMATLLCWYLLCLFFS